MRRWRIPAALVALAAAAAAPVAAAAPAVRSTTALANHCFALTSSGRVVAHAGAGYRAVPRGSAGAAALYLKPTGPGTYMLYDDGGQLLGVEGGAVARVGGAELAGPSAEWRIARAGARAFRVVRSAGGGGLAVAPGSGTLTLGASARF